MDNSWWGSIIISSVCMLIYLKIFFVTRFFMLILFGNCLSRTFSLQSLWFITSQSNFSAHSHAFLIKLPKNTWINEIFNSLVLDKTFVKLIRLSCKSKWYKSKKPLQVVVPDWILFVYHHVFHFARLVSSVPVWLLRLLLLGLLIELLDETYHLAVSLVY